MIHQAASTGFGRSADAYLRGRPQYPGEAIDWLWKALVLAPGALVVDVGAGTGKLTLELIERGAAVVAVEPVDAMRERLVDAIPAATVLPDSAESMPVDAASADAVVAAQAFHWFATDAALREFHRVLRHGARLGLIWNRRRLDDPLQAAISRLLEPHRGDAPRHASGAWRRPLDRSSLFESVAEHEVDFCQELDREGLIDRVGSTSFVAALRDDLRGELLGKVGELVEPGGRVRLPYVCESFVYAQRD